MVASIHRGDEDFTLAGTTYPFLLTDGGGGLGARSVSPFAPKTATGDRSYQDYEWLSVTALADLSGGLGQERLVDAAMYYASRNVDARGGRLVLGPGVTTTSTAAGLDSHSQDLLDGTYAGAGAPALDYLGIGGTPTKLAVRIVIPTGLTDLRRVWLPLAVTAAAGTVTVTLYAEALSLPGTQLETTTIDRNEFAPWGGWTPAVFAVNVPVTAGTAYWLSVEHTGAATACQWYGGTSADAAYSAHANAAQWNGSAWGSVAGGAYWHLPALYDGFVDRPDAPVKLLMGAGEDTITRLWGVSGRQVWYVNPTTDALTYVQDGSGNPYAAEAGILDAVWFRAAAATYSSLYLALGDDTDMRSFDGNIGAEQWTTLTGAQARALAVYAGWLWRADEANQVSASLDGSTYGTMVAVGDATYPVVRLLGWNGYLWAGKSDGLYRISYPAGYPGSGAPTCEKILDFTAQADARNFSVMLEHQGNLIFALGQGLMLYTVGNLLTSITPDTGLEQAVAQRSYYRAAASSLNVLWVAAEGPLGSDSSILAYVDGHWHALYTAPRAGDMLRSVYLEPGLYDSVPRLWFTSGLDLAYCQMPTTTQKRWLWPGLDWAASGYLDSSWLDGGIRSINKDWWQITLHVQDVAADPGPYVQVWWRPDEATAWVQVGADVRTTGIVDLDFPAGSYGPKAQLRIYLYRGTLAGALTTPQVEAVVLKHIERPEEYRTLTRSYHFGTGQVWRNGLPTGKTLADWVTDLLTLRTAAEPLTLRLWYGLTVTGHIVDYDIREAPGAQGDFQDEGSLTCTLRFQELR